MANNNTVKKKKVKMSTGDKVFTVINTVIMILVCIAIVYPLYYVLLASVTDPIVVSSGKFLLYPEAWYANGYATTLKYQPLWTGYANTIKYTVLGTLISLVCTIPAGYALSRYDMVGRKPIMFLFTFTMFFSGGMIPMYLTVQQLHIYNTTWAMVLPKQQKLTVAATLDFSSKLQFRCRKPSSQLCVCSMRLQCGTSSSMH